MTNENKKDILNEIARQIRKESPTYLETEVLNEARQIVIALLYVISFSMIKKISRAVGSPDLSITYERVRIDMSSVASDLICASIQLDHSGAFPKKLVEELYEYLDNNPLAASILRYLTVEHFYMFPVDYQIKQGICAKLGIPYKQIQSYSKNRLLLSEHNP